MEKEILELIERDLPNHVGNVLKKKIEQADKDAATIEIQSKEIVIYKKNVSTLMKHGAEMQAELDIHTKLDDKIQALEERERNLKISILQIELEAEKYKTTFMNSVTMGLVRNVEYRQSIHESDFKTVPIVDQFGGTRFEPESHTNTYSKVEKAE